MADKSETSSISMAGIVHAAASNIVVPLIYHALQFSVAFVNEGVEGLVDDEWMGDDWAAHEALKALKEAEEEEGLQDHGDFDGDFGEDCD